MRASKTALHHRSDGRWEAWEYIDTLVAGYCMNPDWVCWIVTSSNPFEGLAWRDIWDRQGHPEHYELSSILARCPWITEEAWERDRKLRIEHRSQFHSDGHETEAEALACYQSFLEAWGMREI